MTPLRVLFVEDSEDDAALSLRELRRGGFSLSYERVETADEMREALAKPWDIILSDYSMPSFNGLHAVALAHEVAAETPVVIVSGTIGEETAVAALQAGACDFVLKDRIGRLNAAVQRAIRERDERNARRRAEEAGRRMSHFLANMSHELRTPLNAIIGFAEILLSGEVPRDAPEHDEFLGDVLKSGRHLLELVNDVLDLSKVEAGKMEFSPVPTDLAALARETLSITGAAASSRGVLLASDVAEVPGVVVDPLRLKQVLYNYLSNAIKFTPSGGKVTLRVLAPDAQNFRIEVEDQGPGIAAPDLERLFVEFQQLRSTGAAAGGTGLGLAVTKRLVEEQGGSVGVTSTPGKGSVFSATLPREAPTKQAATSR